MSDTNASPVCYAADADDSYMGYMGRTELIASLNALIEAERAGARIGLALRNEGGPDIRSFIRTLHAEEAHWCGQLSDAVRRLGGTPSERCGDFYERTLAITDPVTRLVFVNRGQRWVVSKLESLLPAIRDETLDTTLRAMRDSHRANVAQAGQLIATGSG